MPRGGPVGPVRPTPPGSTAHHGPHAGLGHRAARRPRPVPPAQRHRCSSWDGPRHPVLAPALGQRCTSGTPRRYPPGARACRGPRAAMLRGSDRRSAHPCVRSRSTTAGDAEHDGRVVAMPRRILVPCSSLGRAQTPVAARSSVVSAGTHRSSHYSAPARRAGHTRSTWTTAGRQAWRSSCAVLSLIGGGGPVLGWSRCASPAGPAPVPAGAVVPWGWSSRWSAGGVVFLFRGGPLRGGRLRRRGEGVDHSGREGGELGGRRVPPPVGGRDAATPVGRSCRRSVVSSSRGDYSRDRAGVPLPRTGGAGNGGECRESTVLLCSGVCAPCASGPAMIRTAPLLGTGTPDRAVLHAHGLAVGVAVSHGPVYRAGLSPDPWSRGPMRLWGAL